jgi:hypothetical protein
MKYPIVLALSGLLFCSASNAQVVLEKVDSTLKIGKVGYRVECKNKKYDRNELTVRPVGFESAAREMNFYINGRVAKAQVDDLNSDGYPDLVLFIYSDSNAVYGTVYAFMSEANKSITPAVLPDVMLDGKVNGGYKGHDQFSLMEGYLLQKFPIYVAGDNKDKPTGGTRVLLYQLGKNESGGFKFNRVRTYDTK